MADDVEMTPITPEEAAPVPPKVAPFGASAPAPAAAPSPTAGVSTIKLKPVIRKPHIHKPVVGGSKPASPEAAAAVKKATQNLKAVTGPIPMQATLRKTGIIAEGILTPAQQQAAKSKTSRISLESAIGVAPVKETPAPMKTIRLRRPTDLKPGGPAPLVPPRPPVSDTEVPPTPPAPASEGEEAGVTQKKTLKLHRPSGLGVKRPTLGIKKPGESAGPAAVPSDGGDVPDMPADMGDVPELKPLAPMDFSAASASDMSAGVPGWVAALSLVTTIAALLVLGVVVYFLYQEGVGPVAGANEMPFIQM